MGPASHCPNVSLRWADYSDPDRLPGFGMLENEPPDHATRLMDVSPDGLIGWFRTMATLRCPRHGSLEFRDSRRHYLTKARSAAWSSDGKSVVYGTVHGDLNLIPAEGGESVTLISAAASAGKNRPIEDLDISPDGAGFGLLRGTFDGKSPQTEPIPTGCSTSANSGHGSVGGG